MIQSDDTCRLCGKHAAYDIDGEEWAHHCVDGPRFLDGTRLIWNATERRHELEKRRAAE